MTPTRLGSNVARSPDQKLERKSARPQQPFAPIASSNRYTLVEQAGSPKSREPEYNVRPADGCLRPHQKQDLGLNLPMKSPLGIHHVFQETQHNPCDCFNSCTKALRKPSPSQWHATKPFQVLISKGVHDRVALAMLRMYHLQTIPNAQGFSEMTQWGMHPPYE